MSNEDAIENVRTIQKGYLKLIEQKVDEGTFLTDDFEGTWKANTPLTEIYKRNAESLEVAIEALDFVREQGACKYCYEDSDGYVPPLEKDCDAYVHGSKLILSAKGWTGECRINYCPMCGRRLR